MTHLDSISDKTEKILTPRGVWQSKFLRYGAILPLAGVFTVGLALTMAGLIAAEFTPQEKIKAASFEINPVVDDLPDVTRTIEVDPLQDVEVPPAMPTVATVQTAAVELPIREVTGRKTEFKMVKLDLGNLDRSIRVDKDPVPHVRIPPVFPTRFLQGDVSGYCRVRFDIGSDGKPFNVLTTICTNKQLKSPTVKSVQQWKYAPEVRDGQAVIRRGLETTIRFNLNDDRGQPLPLPSGY